jgi:predicted SprT family Zn-dependent metalloprotease
MRSSEARRRHTHTNRTALCSQDRAGTIVRSSVSQSRALSRGRAFLNNLGSLWGAPLASVLLKVNPRLTRSAGRSLASKSIVELSPATVAGSASFRREVLCHEAAHAVVWARLGRNARPHGPEWQELVRQAGFEPRASLIRCGYRAQSKPPQQFRHTCPVCHFSKCARRRMPRWRCPECRAAGLEGTLRIERVPNSR